MTNNNKQQYPTNREPGLLAPIARQQQRQQLGITKATLPFNGLDTWHAWEFTWLNTRGKPQAAVARIQVPSDSPQLIESKSMKLYLGSCSGTRFDNHNQAVKTLEADLTDAAQAQVSLALLTPELVRHQGLAQLPGTCLDDLDIEISNYHYNPNLLKLQNAETVNESLHTQLFKSLCPLTGQPDFADILVQYQGAAINHESLLHYLVSYRLHKEFAEQIAERIFVDIMAQCAPQRLTITANYTRRGGIDINAHRTNDQTTPQATPRLWRQ